MSGHKSVNAPYGVKPALLDAKHKTLHDIIARVQSTYYARKMDSVVRYSFIFIFILTLSCMASRRSRVYAHPVLRSLITTSPPITSLLTWPLSSLS